MDKSTLRKTAISRCLAGERPLEVATSLGVSKAWIYKWLSRYKAAPDQAWYQGFSTAPKQVQKKVANTTEQQIVAIRKRLSKMKYAQIGAISIQYEFRRLGVEPPPIWTINRVLKRHGLVSGDRPRHRKKKSTPKCISMFNKWIWWVPGISKETEGFIAATLSIHKLIRCMCILFAAKAPMK